MTIHALAMKPIRIRTATPEDAVSLIHVHYASVHSIPENFYSPEIIDLWSPKPDDRRYAWMSGLISKGEAIIMIAQNSDEILGFSIVLPKQAELRALYVTSTAHGQGIGQMLLEALEENARGQGINKIHLNASLNAQSFYLQNGYGSDGLSTLGLSDQLEMPCIKMSKVL